MVRTAIEFFQRHDAINVFDQLWKFNPCDLLSLSSTCKDLREAVDSYCAGNKRINEPSSSSQENFPPVCRLVRWWMCHCMSCEEQVDASECLNDIFLPKIFKDFKVIPMCSECMRSSPLMTKITKTEAKLRYGLTDKDLNALDYEAKVNPVYRSAASMKLFYESDLESTALAKFKLLSRTELFDFLQERRAKRATRTEQIRQNKQLSSDERRANLMAELDKHGLELRSDSQIADWYITGSKRAKTLEKSVELIRRAHIVHHHVGVVYRSLLDDAYEYLKDERRNHDLWSEYWQEEKFKAEDEALKLFAKVKANDSLVPKNEQCKCGEPLFNDGDLGTLC